MSSPAQGAWTCAHGVDGRDWCGGCHAPAPGSELTEPQRELLRIMASFPREVTRLTAADAGRRMRPRPWHANRVGKQLLPGLTAGGYVVIKPARHARLIELLPAGKAVGLAVPEPRYWVTKRVKAHALEPGSEFWHGNDWQKVASVSRHAYGQWRVTLASERVIELSSHSILELRVYDQV